MPIWEWDELETCRSQVFQEVTKKDMAKRYSILGGVPRYVFSTDKDFNPQQKVDEAVAKSTLQRLVDCIGEKEVGDDVSHVLVHIDVKPSYTDKDIKFASVFVSERVAVRLQRHEQDAVLRYLQSSEDIGATGALRGYLFEGFAHNALCHGGEFSIRGLWKTGEISTLELPGCTETIIQTAGYSDGASEKENDEDEENEEKDKENDEDEENEKEKEKDKEKDKNYWILPNYGLGCTSN